MSSGWMRCVSTTHLLLHELLSVVPFSMEYSDTILVIMLTVLGAYKTSLNHPCAILSFVPLCLYFMLCLHQSHYCSHQFHVVKSKFFYACCILYSLVRIYFKSGFYFLYYIILFTKLVPSTNIKITTTK